MSWAWFKAKGSNTQKGQNTEEEGLLRAPRAQVPMWLSSHPELGQGGALAATEQDSLQRAPSSDLCQEGCTPPGSFLHSRLTQQELPSRGSGLYESLQPPPLRPASLVEAGREGKEEVAERSPRLCKEPVWGEEKVLRKGVSPETWEVLLSPEGLPVLGLLEWDGGGALPALRVCVWRGQQGSPLPQCLSSGGPPRSGWLSRGQLWLVQSLSLPRVSPSSMSPCWNDLKSGVPLGPHFLPEASGDVTVAQPGPLPPRGRGLSPVHPFISRI